MHSQNNLSIGLMLVGGKGPDEDLGTVWDPRPRLLELIVPPNPASRGLARPAVQGRGARRRRWAGRTEEHGEA